ncbi:glycosyltransferase [Spirosoma radiotolerans]|uniref:glycosyltransferase n=1 Tax=Spirosoma radiotolerans TaxID=1379870 RepID=UPI0006988FC5|nr:glycosyltransferase [Spirosoma radiotolerans]
MLKELAIIIPAYKESFLRETLYSISNQTVKLFTVYIGNDASPYNLDKIVNEFSGIIDIKYKVFEVNFGLNDLVAHWNRCIDMSENEPWIWFFSDDDIMESNCVELFYKNKNDFSFDNLFHFNVQIIDENSKKIYNCTKYPRHISTSDFFKMRMNREIESFVVEYIFRRQVFIKLGKFDYFDLAWSADDAAWIKLSNVSGIRSIEGARVKWRLSKINISSFQDNNDIIIRKLTANIKYLNWVELYFTRNSIKDYTTKIKKFKWVFRIVLKSKLIEFSKKKEIAYYILESLNYKGIRLNVLCHILTQIVYDYFHKQTKKILDQLF